MSEKPEIKYKISEHLYIVGGKDAEEVIENIKKKENKLHKEFLSLSDHLDDLL